ncbi:nitrate reductase [uncultured Paraglaciecola sp.]|uniref:nitrate reductase n=1 Tax=uncultured Paraglaciecola sp. TaxID=1765024 RepID=UPI0030D927F9|tara:strand:- start:60272 stop:63007 length:2736 start_codon:yes stop_codon:yes gene_type:complete
MHKSNTGLAPSLLNTTCPYCGVGCGVEVQISEDNKLSDLKGCSDHPANFGRLCVKGNKLLETNSASGRLLSPMIAGKKASWDDAITQVASKFKQLIADHGPDSVAFYVSGQLLTEDYYVANKLMKGYIGSANIDTNSRLCMSSAVAAYKRAFGADAVPCCYEDLEQTELLILVGSNAAWTHPVLFQRIERAKKLNPDMQVVTIDPRRTATSELADIHLAIKPGTDVVLFNGLLAYLAKHQALNSAYITANTQGFEQVIEHCESWTISRVAKQCDINELELLSFYRLFAQTDKVVTAYCMGVNQSSSGTDKANSIINSHLATGKIGREGCGPFSLTGQPNAMGGREVGGLANILACHMDIENPEHRQTVQTYWQSPTIADKPGFKAVDLFENINSGKVKAVWVMATNPMVSMPNRQKIADALKKCELLVVSDCVAKNDTLDYAHVALPATGWSEKDGTVTNSERRISRQRGLLAATGEARHDWKIICDLAKAMGFTSGFNFNSPSEIFAEYAGLTQFDNHGNRDLDLSALSELTETQYNRLKPVQWPVNKSAPYGTKRLFTDGKFYTQNGKAQFVVTEFKAPQQLTSKAFPFVLNSGRVRDQWHTMTRTGKTSELTSHVSRPYLAIHPKDAECLSLQDEDLVSLNAAHSADTSKVCLPVVIDDNQRQGEVFAPIHWSASNASSANITSLYTDANDQISGQPELKHAAVKLDKITYQHYGQMFIQQDLSVELLRQYFDYFVTSPVEKGHLVFFATDQEPASIKQNLQLQLPLYEEWISASSSELNSICAMRQGVMSLILFISPSKIKVDPNWVNSLLNSENVTPEQLHGLLNMQPDEQFKQGKLVCSCFKVGENTIIDAIKAGCDSVDGLGRELQCGTNCGSCKSELSQMVKEYKPKKLNIKQDQLIALEAVS